MPHRSRFAVHARNASRAVLRRARMAAPSVLLLVPTFAATDPAVEKFSREIKPVLEKFCYDCHGNGHDKGGVQLDGFDTAASLHDPKLWSRVLKNTRSGLMPPADEDHLPAAEATKLAEWIKREAFGLDPAQPDPGRMTVRRLNRVEYRNTIRDLTGVDFDTQREFPADDTGHGFDNIADVLTISPMLLEKYLDAAQAIVAKTVPLQSRVVAENQVYGRAFKTVKVDTTIPEPPKPEPPPAPAEAPIVTPVAVPTIANAPAPGTPAAAAAAAAARRGQGRGNRGPMAAPTPPPPIRPVPAVSDTAIDLSYYTPATVAATHHIEHAGKYQLVLDFRCVERYAENLFDQNRCRLIFKADGETLLDREFLREGDKKFELPFDRDWTAGDHELTLEIAPVAPAQIPYRLLRMRVNAVTVRGPFDEKYYVKPKGYEKVFPRDVPAGVTERRAYARELLGQFATRAFRRPVDAPTLDRLADLAAQVAAVPKATFESGIAQAMVAVLAAPRFIFREEETEPLRRGQAHPFIDEYALASRLSYFFWSSMPDAELFSLAGKKQLRANLSAQIDRLLKDSRASEFVHNFAGQWLQARDIATVPITALDVYLRDHPSPEYEAARETFRRFGRRGGGGQGGRFGRAPTGTPEEIAAQEKARAAFTEFNARPKPELTESLRRAMLQETEMTFAHVFQEDRSVLELLECDYTFLNEELARHYGIEGVTGQRMRKVLLAPDSPRGGILSQGTILAVTSNPTRTSPVKRGVFILEAILGTPPAPPPPNIPALEDAATAEELKKLNLRDTLALHAKKPLCASCHLRMDPIGLALENFNAMGMWRDADVGQPVESAGKLITGEKFADVRELKHVLATTRHRDFYYSLAEKMLTYALGRGVEYYDTETLDQLVAKLEATGGKPSALLRGIVESAPFQQRRQLKSSVALDDSPSAPSAASLAQAHP